MAQQQPWLNMGAAGLGGVQAGVEAEKGREVQKPCLANADLELEGTVPVIRRIELLAVLREGSMIVHGQHIAHLGEGFPISRTLGDDLCKRQPYQGFYQGSLLAGLLRIAIGMPQSTSDKLKMHPCKNTLSSSGILNTHFGARIRMTGIAVQRNSPRCDAPNKKRGGAVVVAETHQLPS